MKIGIATSVFTVPILCLALLFVCLQKPRVIRIVSGTYFHRIIYELYLLYTLYICFSTFPVLLSPL